MKKKTIVRIMSIALMVAMIAMCLSNVAFADYTPKGNQGTATGTKFGNILDVFLGLVQIVGIAIAVIMLIVLAIKYISAAPGDKAEIKKHAVVYIVGAVLLFAASGIIQIIKTFAVDTFGS